MSQETLTWLNNNVLVGFTDKRGNAWHHRASDQGIEPNHYAGAIPVDDVLRRLFAWHAIERELFVSVPCEADNLFGASGIDSSGRPFQSRPVPGRKAIVADDTYEVLGVFSDGYRPHQYDEWLLSNVANLLDADLGIASAGLLRNRAVAWVQVEVPESITTPEGVEFRPNLTAATSLDGSLSTTYARQVTNVVCHAAGTPIIDGEWRGAVEDHPTATVAYTRSGRTIRVHGLPFAESVSDEHRYWVRERCRSITQRRAAEIGATGHSVGQDLAPQWVEAQRIKPVQHEIGYPIDYTERPVADGIASNQDAWILGYAWGNGHFGGAANQVCLSIPNARPDIIHDIETYAKAQGWCGKPRLRQGCVQITFSHPALRAALADFKRDGWAQKVPPVWAEEAPLDWQRALVAGYYTADGNVDTTEGCIISSVSLDGLLGLRQILARLGVASSIRRGSDPSLRNIIQGRKVNAQESYTLRFVEGAAQFDLPAPRFQRSLHPYLEDGILWSRVQSTSEWEGEVWPITTDSHQYLTAFGRSHNCDNTLHAGLSETGQRIKIKHSSRSLGRLGDAREALAIVYSAADDFAAEVTRLCNWEVSPAEWSRLLDLNAEVPTTPGRGQTLATAKRDSLESLWARDARVSPWAGTAFGVLQAFNTYDSHVKPVRGNGRAERASLNALTGRQAAADNGVLLDLSKITGRQLVSA